MSKQERQAFLESLSDFTLYETSMNRAPCSAGSSSHWNERSLPKGHGKVPPLPQRTIRHGRRPGPDGEGRPHPTDQTHRAMGGPSREAGT